MSKKKKHENKLKAYPSVAALVVQTAPQKVAMRYLADVLTDLQVRVRRVELKVAVDAAESKTSWWSRIKPW